MARTRMFTDKPTDGRMDSRRAIICPYILCNKVSSIFSIYQVIPCTRFVYTKSITQSKGHNSEIKSPKAAVIIHNTLS